jgi:lactose/L-arabinose transport system ATP-binding protein
MRLELARLHKQIGATMIYVTHDQVEAMTLADKIFVLQGGVVRQAGRPLQLYDDPDNRFVAGFIGSPGMNFLSCTVVAATENGVSLMPEATKGAAIEARIRGTRPAPGSQVTVGMRPEHCEIAADPAAGIVLSVDMEEDLGGVSYLHARTAAGHPFVLERRGERKTYEGREITVTIPPERALVFDEAGERLR